MNKKYLIIISVLVLAVGLIIWNSSKTNENRTRLIELIPDGKAQVVAGETCGCCKLYAEYLEKQGFDVDLQLKSNTDMEAYKKENQIPQSLKSCHTTRIGAYIIEGHIPMEAIEKLFKEKPDIAGIGMGGMPSGSPGMPGPKEPFKINVITKDGKDGGLFIEL